MFPHISNQSGRGFPKSILRSKMFFVFLRCIQISVFPWLICRLLAIWTTISALNAFSTWVRSNAIKIKALPLSVKAVKCGALICERGCGAVFWLVSVPAWRWYRKLSQEGAAASEKAYKETLDCFYFYSGVINALISVFFCFVISCTYLRPSNSSLSATAQR